MLRSYFTYNILQLLATTESYIVYSHNDMAKSLGTTREESRRQLGFNPRLIVSTHRVGFHAARLCSSLLSNAVQGASQTRYRASPFSLFRAPPSGKSLNHQTMSMALFTAYSSES